MTTTPTSPRTGIGYFLSAVPASKLSNRVAVAVTMPLLAVTVLEASPTQVGLLSAAGTAAFPLLALPAGVWLDRVRRRPVMILADVLRGALLLSVPLAAVLASLSLAQLFVVAALTGVCTLLFDLGAQSHLPDVAGRETGLARANAQLGTIDAVGNVGAPALGSWAVQVVGAPLALAGHAMIHLASAVLLGRLRVAEPRPSPDTVRGWSAVGEGLSYVARHPILRAVTLAGAMTNLALAMALPMLPVVLVGELGWREATVGLLLGAGGIGGVIGAATSRMLGSRLGEGRSLVVIGVGIGPAMVLLPPIGDPIPLWLATAGWFVVAFKVGYDNVQLVTFRQRSTPERLLGRVNATVRLALYGSLSLGGIVAAGIAARSGARVALWVAAVVFASVWIPLATSPLRGVRTLDDPALQVRTSEGRERRR